MKSPSNLFVFHSNMLFLCQMMNSVRQAFTKNSIYGEWRIYYTTHICWCEKNLMLTKYASIRILLIKPTPPILRFWIQRSSGSLSIKVICFYGSIVLFLFGFRLVEFCCKFKKKEKVKGQPHTFRYTCTGLSGKETCAGIPERVCRRSCQFRPVRRPVQVYRSNMKIPFWIPAQVYTGACVGCVRYTCAGLWVLLKLSFILLT